MKSLDLSKVALQTERNFKLTPYHIATAALKFSLSWTSDEELAKESPEWNVIAHFGVEPSLADKKNYLARALIEEWVETYKPNIKSLLLQAYRENPTVALTLKAIPRIPAAILNGVKFEDFWFMRDEWYDTRGSGREYVDYSAFLRREHKADLNLGKFEGTEVPTLDRLKERILERIDNGTLSVSELT